MKLDVTEVAFARRLCRTRLPFRFGAVTVHAAELLTCRVTVRGEGGDEQHGWSGDLMVPRWFRKDTDATPEQDAQELFESATTAAQCYVAHPCDTPFAIWRQVQRERVDAAPFDQPDQLVRGFGIAIVERAVIDAACRAVAMPFADALRSDVFGFRPEQVHAQLGGWNWRADLPLPNTKVTVRHTVGMLDVLREQDLDEDARVADGLPQTLDRDIDEYGLQWFKVKIGAGFDRDRARLLDLAQFFADRGQQVGLSLDGNEQYEDLAQLAAVLEAVNDEPRGRELLSHLAWIEQPLARSSTFVRERHLDLDRVTRFAPLILDEADATPQSFLRALDLGYRGVSVKNCKGVFRALCNFGICRLGGGRFQSGEDLTNIGVLPLQQDLVTASVLGLPHVERNGHHYFRGLQHLDPEVQTRALSVHGDLYRRLEDGVAALRIVDGHVDVGSSLAAIGYGTGLGDLSGDLELVACR